MAESKDLFVLEFFMMLLCSLFNNFRGELRWFCNVGFGSLMKEANTAVCYVLFCLFDKGLEEIL